MFIPPRSSSIGSDGTEGADGPDSRTGRGRPRERKRSKVDGEESAWTSRLTPGDGCAILIHADSSALEQSRPIGPDSGRPVSCLRRCGHGRDRVGFAGSGSGRQAIRGSTSIEPVDQVPRRLAQEDPADLLGGLGPQLDEPLDAVEGRVRRQDHPGVVAEPVVVERLALEDVDPGAEQVARVEGLDQRLLVDDRAPRRVDQDRARAASWPGPRRRSGGATGRRGSSAG